MNFVQPKYPIEIVNAAGKTLIKPYDTTIEDTEWENALDVVNNWRASHAYPLNTFTVNLRAITRRIASDALVAQRIKRLPSIALKLELHPKMKLSQMQDLGGCRAILPDVASVKAVVNYYETISSIKHVRQEPDNYILPPKRSGYRGVHLIYRYFSDKKSKAIYNGMKIEIQIRTKYQHAWATAVETVGMFSGQALKSSLGSADWRRFFSLMGSAIALREKSALIPETPTLRSQLISELSAYANTLKVADRLREYGRALHALSSASKDSYFFLLQLYPSKSTLDVRGFSIKEALLAEQEYTEAEAASKKDGSDVVLVSVDSVNALGKAYPNYFADTRLFVELLEQAISGKSRGIRIPETKLQQATLPFPERATR